MDDDTDGEYTRFRANIQRGDGPDQRGDVTVEMVRERDVPADPDPNDRTAVELPDGETVYAVPADEAFAEFYNELQRAERALVEALGLDDDGEQ